VLTLHPLNPTTGPRQRRLPVAYLLIYLSPHYSPITGPTSTQPLACAATFKQRLVLAICSLSDARLRRLPGPSKACPGPAQLSKTQVRKAPEACPSLGCLGCPVQGWPGLDRIPHPPPAIHACGGRPQGGEGRRAPTYKPQGFSEQKPRLAAGWPGLGWAGFAGSSCEGCLATKKLYPCFVLTVLNC